MAYEKNSQVSDFSASAFPIEASVAVAVAAGYVDLGHRLTSSDRGSVDLFAVAAAAAAAAAADATNRSSCRSNCSAVGSSTEAAIGGGGDSGGGVGGHSAAALALMWTAAAAIILWTAVGNMTIWATLGRSRRLRSASNYLVANLAVSDFLLGVAVLPLSAAYDVLQHWPFGRAACVAWLLADVLLCTASIWSLLVIAADRYLATFYPHCYRGRRWRRRVALYVAVVWAASLLTSVPPVFGLGDTMEAAYAEPSPGRRVCILFDNVEYVLFSSCMTFYVPSVALFAIYARIFVEIHRRSRMNADCRQPMTPCIQRRSPPIGRRVSAAAAVAAAAATAAALSRCSGGAAATVAAADSAVTDGCCERLMNGDGEDEGGGGSSEVGRQVPLAFPESFNDLCAAAAVAASTSSAATTAVESSSSTSEPYSYSEAERFAPFMSPAKMTLISLAEASHDGDNDDSNGSGGGGRVEQGTPRRWTPWSPAPARGEKRSGGRGFGSRRAAGERREGGRGGRGGESAEGANVGDGGGRGSTGRRQGDGGGRAASRRRYEVREQRATKVMVTIVICFVACWLPFFVVYTVRSVCDVCVSAGVQTFVIWLGYANSALNPVLYSIFNQEFRDELRRGGCLQAVRRCCRSRCRLPCCWYGHRHQNRSSSGRNGSSRNTESTLAPGQ